ncbi:unnamed protein product [Sympodiomycopsis kandeliae]
MAWTCSGKTNSELINNLSKKGLLSNERVKRAMTLVDRKNYCLPSGASQAYSDSPQSIGYSVTISAPHMHAHAIESLLPFLPSETNNSILDIGSGSGYLLACFHHLTTNGKVVGIEHIQPLVDQSIQNLKNDKLGEALEKASIQVVKGDGRLGWPDGAPYNAIHVGAASSPNVLATLEAQLARPGRLFIPVEDPDTLDQDIYHVDKDSEGKITRKKMYGVRYVPLCDEQQQWPQ